MSTEGTISGEPGDISPSVPSTLRRLFLTLFLRGRSARGLQKDTAPTSIARKLWLTLVFYALFGMLAISFSRQPVFLLSAYLHAMTFIFLGMFIASSAGEILFNKEEADILLHRPVSPKQLLWAKVQVMLVVSLWLAVAFNFVGLLVGIGSGGWLFVPVHLFSTLIEALSCTACVIIAYELCLRWFGRERLDGVMTTAQVIISVAAVLSGQVFPQLVIRFDKVGAATTPPWWTVLLPPAWFAAFDDALVGSGSLKSWLLAGFAVSVTLVVLWIAFGRLAESYVTGLKLLNETAIARPKSRATRRLLDRLTTMPPLCWLLRDPVTRAAFLLSSAYLVRDRDVKLRVYPGLAPFLVMPIILLFPRGESSSAGGPFSIAFAGAFLGLVPLLGLSMLQYSQQWQASDVFRSAPIGGPARIYHGARYAVICLLLIPMALVFCVIASLGEGINSKLLLLVPGIIASPVFALVPGIRNGLPLSIPGEEAQSAGRGVAMIGTMMLCVALAGIAAFSWSMHYFGTMLLVETTIAVVAYFVLRFQIDRAKWCSLE